jgi:hypothetical protein
MGWRSIFATVLFALGVGALARASGAQIPAPSDAEVVQQLASDDPVELAWGAYLAGERRVYEAVPALVERARQPLSTQPTTDEALRTTILDALIRLDARLDCDEVLAVAGERALTTLNAQALILMPHWEAATQQLLLGWLDDSRLCRRAFEDTSRLLVANGTPGIGARLVRGWVWTVTVEVHDPGSFGGGVSGRICCRRAAVRPRGFPPYSSYRLDREPELGDRVFLAGQLPIFVRRAGVTSATPSTAGDAPVARAKFLRGLMAEGLGLRPEDLALDVISTVRVPFIGADDYLRAVDAHLDLRRAEFADLVRCLAEVRWLSGDEAAELTPTFRIEVRDRRREPREPLPELPEPTSAQRPAR